MRALVWFRSDLRIADHTALSRASRAADRSVVGVFVMCPKQWKQHDWSNARVDFILRTLPELRDDLGKLNIPLKIIEHSSFDRIERDLVRVARSCSCDGLYFNDEYEVNEKRRDEAVERAFRSEGLEVHRFTDQVILPPESVRTQSDTFYSVYTPFRKKWLEQLRESDQPHLEPTVKRQASIRVSSDSIPDTISGFERTPDLESIWHAGERVAQKRLRLFVKPGLADYKSKRDAPSNDGTSRLSPYLAIGAISPRQCLHAAIEANDGRIASGRVGPQTWINELIWREFYRHVLVGWPRVCMNRPFKLDTENLDWRDDDAGFEAWCEGRTGVPIVDAAMRQLKAEAWMHNRCRMIVAMFLTKNLLIDWRRGERFFMRHLIDGDFASNNGGWQWSASTGTDAAPYFRIFNPISQSRKFDPKGEYVRKFVPELDGFDDDAIHEPRKQSDLFDNLDDYPEPIVDLKKSRQRAIDAFKALSND